MDAKSTDPKRRAPMMQRAVDMVLRYWPIAPTWQQLVEDYGLESRNARIQAAAVRRAFLERGKRKVLG
jgi:hypothetical protein